MSGLLTRRPSLWMNKWTSVSHHKTSIYISR